MDHTAQLRFELPFCSAPGCDGAAGVPGTARGLCSSHYHKWQRYGDALHEPQKPSWKTTSLAWVAGFVDADGTIILESSSDERQAILHRYVPKIAATNADARPIKFLHDMFGGTFYMHKRSEKGKSRERISPKWHQFVWAVSGTKAVQVARAIEPYLQRKAAQARILIEFEEGNSYSRGGNALGKRRTEFELQRRATLSRGMKNLNRNLVGEVRICQEAP